MSIKIQLVELLNNKPTGLVHCFDLPQDEQTGLYTFENLQALCLSELSKNFKLAHEAKLKYPDDEGDLITLSSSEELQEAIHSTGAGREGKLLRVHLDVEKVEEEAADKQESTSATASEAPPPAQASSTVAAENAVQGWVDSIKMVAHNVEQNPEIYLEQVVSLAEDVGQTATTAISYVAGLLHLGGQPAAAKPEEKKEEVVEAEKEPKKVEEEPPIPVEEAEARLLEQLSAMGFADKAKNVKALGDSKGDLNAAVSKLLDDGAKAKE